MTDNEDLAARAAWLYHVENLTQAEIGQRLNMTRRRVNEILGEARESGLVTVTLNTSLAECLALGAEISARFRLREAVVVPTPEDPAQTHTVLGRATAAHLNRLVSAQRPASVGVGWGKTLSETVRFLHTASGHAMTVYSMMGGLVRGLEINTFEIARGFARAWSAESRYFVAPIYADSEDSRDAIVSQTVFRQTYKEIGEVDVAVLSVGDVSDRSLQVRYGLPDDVSPDELRRAGAVGDIVGRFLDADGNAAPHRLNQQVLSPTLDQLRQIDNLIVTSGGIYKADILAAVLKGGYVNTLITDEETARRIAGSAET